jgi:hypothetical protein
LTITLPPGLFASLGAISQTCSAAQFAMMIPQCPPASQIGFGSLTAAPAALPTAALQMDVKLFMMPAPVPSDAAGVGAEVVTPNSGIPVTKTTGTVTEQELNGNPVLLLSLPNMPDSLGTVGIQVGTLSFTINGTAATATGTASSTPFTRLPTNCQTATSLINIQTYSGATAQSSSSFTPTNCSALGFHPTITASATRDKSDVGVTLITTVATNPAEAANKTLVITVPTATLAPDVFNAGHLFGHVIGSATAITPLVTTPLVGTVTLTGTIAQPALTISFPPPFSLTFTGGINILANSVTFSSVPDVPLNSLTLKLEGNATSLFYTTCAKPKGTLSADFGGQNGASSPETTPLNIVGCPKPVVAKIASATVGGLKNGKAKLAFSLAAGDGSANLSSFTLSLPKGLSFNKDGLKAGVKLSGAKLKSASVNGSKLTVKLKSAVSHLTVKLTPSALTESSALLQKLKSGKVKSLLATITTKNTSGSTLSLKLKLDA